jgi:rare lipoprotein A (peptidoglycan hydrolase)
VTIDRRHVLIREPQEQRSKQPRKIKIFAGDATYYNLPGLKRASGQRFDPNKMTAAMTAEKVRLGQTVIVTCTAKNKNGSTATPFRFRCGE